MKKSLLIILSATIVVAGMFSACAGKKDDTSTATTTTKQGLEAADNEFGFETEVVTDDKGKEVTDKEGKKVTQEVPVVYKTNKSGGIVIQKVDPKSGEPMTDKKGNDVTIKSTTSKTTTTKKGNDSGKNGGNSGDKDKSDKKTTADKSSTTKSGGSGSTTSSTTKTKSSTTRKTTGTTKSNVSTTKSDETSKYKGDDEVPDVDDTGSEVTFSVDDQEIISSMLEVPHLFDKDYKSETGVPIETAAYAAVWMLKHDGNTSDLYTSSPVVLGLFKYYGQTVINFKQKCNSVNNPYITYNAADDTFSVDLNNYPDKVQTVKIKKIYDMGNNNYYKVVADVSGAKRNGKNITSVTAIIQKNLLDINLGFSIKALEWK